ncbi:hypothetical protein AB1Y20_021762 [Prymnesium parvum]|uniref:Right handed beta helix domain-containing protein n=1 Tax=Prymnesium parvum TaxID=97485 RepID=A0AB34JJ78_PRYPA
MAADAAALFKAGDFAAATAAFASLLGGLGGMDAAVALTNRAACHAKLGDKAAAEKDSRSAIAASPEYARAHLRLALSLPLDHDDAAAAVASAIALAAGPPNEEMRALYHAIARASATSRGLRLDRVEIGSVKSVRTSLELNRALGHGNLVVLRPGSYQLGPSLAGGTLVGVGDVVLTASPFCGHAMVVKTGLLQVVNVGLIGDGTAAAACCCHEGTLRLVSCRVIDYAEVGVLVADFCTAYLHSCVFERLTRQAIEVREGGSVDMCDCRIEACKQGVSAYGGALSARLHRCAILNCQMEGVLISGSDVNAATRAQEAQLHPKPKSAAIAVTEQAMNWGRERRQTLSSTIIDCTISGNGSIGISIDYGAQVVIERCAFQMNDPYSILVKGASDLSVFACQFTFAGKSSKSFYVQQCGGRVANLAGVHVAINYGGEVQVCACAFSGPRELGIEEECLGLHARVGGMWSKPALSLQNHFDCCQGLPSLALLGVEAQQIRTPRRKKESTVVAPIVGGALSRIGWTFQRESWSPTATEYYAIGNTQGYDVMGGMLGSPSKIRIFLAGCGDPRNLVATAAAVPAGVAISFVLNDGNVSILARDAVLLHLMATVPPEAMPETVLAVWSSHGLSAAHASALQASCAALAEEPWPDWLRAATGIEGGESSAAAEAPMREACRAWASCSITLSKLLELRKALQAAAPRTASASFALSLSTLDSKDSKANKEVKEYVQTGSLTSQSKLTSPNVTLLLAPSLQYCLYFSSSIFRALPLADARPGTPLSARLLTALAPQLQTVAARLHAGTMDVSVVLGDVLVVGADPASNARFDYIDCSNVADYVSVTSMLQICAPLLCRAPHARVRLESILLYRSSSETEKKTFARDATGLPAQTLASLLGVRFVSSEELTGGVLRMEWASAHANEQEHLSAGGLLLDLAPRFSQVLRDGPSEDAAKWRPIGGGPLALTHLLKVSLGPAVARTLIDALLRIKSCRRGKLFQWELTMHVPRTQSELVSVSFDVAVESSSISHARMRHVHNPLLIAFSRNPLELGDTPFGLVHQLLSSFHLDEYSGMATFAMPANLAAKTASLHVTLCALGRKGLEALNTSRLLSDLPKLSLSTAWRSLDPLPVVLDTSSVFDAKEEDGVWKVAVVSGPLHVAADVLIPKALLESKERVVSAVVAGRELRVTIKSKEGGSVHSTYEVQLPSNVAQGVPMRAKLSRSLGLLCMKIAWVEEALDVA